MFNTNVTRKESEKDAVGHSRNENLILQKFEVPEGTSLFCGNSSIIF